MRSRQHDNGEPTWQQTSQQTSRYIRHLSGGLLGSNRAKEQRLGAEPSWCHSPISGDLPRGSNSGVAILSALPTLAIRLVKRAGPP
jgi:hypothetical protein